MRFRPPLAARELLARLFLGGATLWFLACSPEANQDTSGASGGGPPLPNPTTEASSSGGGPAMDTVGTGGKAPDIDISPPPNTCTTPDAARQVMADQAVYFTQPFGRVLYSWTTAEQEQELRSLGPLLSVGEAPGLGKGIAMDRLTARAAGPNASLLDIAVSEKFATFRYSWPRPWATRLGMPGEDYGDRLVQMKLAPHSWIGRIDPQSGGIDLVVDLFGEVIPLDQAEQAVDRIAALYYENVATGEADAPDCYFGTFTILGGSGGYREFVVGNPDMVEEWSLGTEEILVRLQADIQALSSYLQLIRSCPSPIGSNFNAEVSCLWGSHDDPYFEALALPSELYKPRAEQLVKLISTLESSLFSLDPFVRRQDANEPPGDVPQPEEP